MDFNEEILEQIDKYLLGRMDEEEARKFEEQIETNPDLKEQVRQQRILLFAIENAEENELREDIKATNDLINSIRSKTSPEYSTSYGSRLRKIATSWQGVAAAVMLLLVGSTFLYFFLQKATPTELYNAYYETPPNLIAQQSRSTEFAQDTDLQNIMELYDQEQYKKALNKASIYLEENPKQEELLFYKGIMHLELGHHQAAIEALSNMLNRTDAYRDRGLWYQSLAYLAAGNEEKAKACLERLQQRPPSTYQEKAKVLISKL